jgi:hypothetical protein
MEVSGQLYDPPPSFPPGKEALVGMPYSQPGHFAETKNALTQPGIESIVQSLYRLSYASSL